MDPRISGFITIVSSLKNVIKSFEDAKKAGKELNEETIKSFHKSLSEYIKWASEISKVSQIINMSAQDLTSLAFVAEREASVGFNSFVKAMKELNLSMTEAQDTTSDAAKAFNELKVNIEENGNLRNVVDVFYDISDSIKNTQDASRSGLAQMIMGDFGVDLIPMLENGKDRIMELSREFRNMGVTIDTLDASAIAELDKSLMMIKTRFKAPVKWWNELFLPTKEYITVPLEETFVKVWDFFSELLGFKEAPEGVKKLSENVHELKKESEQIITPLDKVNETTQQIGETSEVANKKLSPIFNASIFTAFQGTMANATTLMNDFCIAVEGIVNMSDDLAIVAQIIQDMMPTNEQVDNIHDAANETERLANAGGGKNQSANKPGGTDSDSLWDSEGYYTGDLGGVSITRNVEELDQKLNTFWDGFKSAAKSSIGSVQEGLSGLASFGAAIFLKLYEAWNETWDKIQANLSDAFYRMFEEGISFTVAMKDMWEEMKRAFKRALADMLADLIAFSAKTAIETGIAALFEKGGIAGQGAGSLPKIPRAAKGLMTTGHGPIPAILHPNEVVIPQGYIREFFGSMAERLFKYMSLPSVPAMPIHSLASAGASKVVNINLNVGAGNFDDPSYWRNLFRTKIKPAMDDVNYGRI